ncbi:DUF192 domain-containing protein [Candidatus Parcubacteria bacterium]|nr:DUF192 domain-containing protein [Candidatus Parcubacteria bacterium]
MKVFIVLAITLVLLGSVYFVQQEKPESDTSYSLTTIELADTTEKRVQGLSGREDVPEDYGMLFVFDTKGEYEFWMKDMLVSIDLIWLSDDGTIVGVEDSVFPETYPKLFAPPEPVRYVLETRAGLARAKGWEVGATLSLPLR